MRYPAALALCLVCCLPAVARDTEPYRRPLRDQSRELYKRAVTDYQWSIQFRRLQHPNSPVQQMRAAGSVIKPSYWSSPLFQPDVNGTTRWAPSGYRFLHPGYQGSIRAVPRRYWPPQR